MHTISHRIETRADALVAGVLGCVALVEIVLRSGLDSPQLLSVGALALISAGAVAFRKRRPLLSLALYLGSYSLIALSFGYWDFGVGLVVLVILLYSAAAYTDGPVTTVAGGLGVVAVLVFVAGNPGRGLEDITPGDFVFIALPLAVGAAVRYREGLAKRDRRRWAEEQEKERASRMRAAIEDERRKIARELHDIVAHGVSLMVVQAEAGQSLLATSPVRAADAFSSIQDAGRHALLELRRLLMLLRDEDGEPSLAPQPGLDQIETLAKQFNEAGLTTEVDTRGRLDAIPQGVALAAHRVIQEALTNTLKHSRSAKANVRVICDEEMLKVEIQDEGLARLEESVSPGHGLVGMRERVDLYGGDLRVVNEEGKGYRVTAIFPLVESP